MPYSELNTLLQPNRSNTSSTQSAKWPLISQEVSSTLVFKPGKGNGLVANKPTIQQEVLGYMLPVTIIE